MGRFVVAVADVQALAVLHVLLFAREIPGRRGVLVGQGQSLGQLAAGVHPAGEHVHDGTGTGLPAQIGVQHCLAAADPARFHHAAGAQHHHEVLVGLRHGFQQLLLVLRDADVAAVQAFALVGVATPRHSGRNWTGCYTIRPWNMHSLCWVERWSTIVPLAATTAG